MKVYCRQHAFNTKVYCRHPFNTSAQVVVTKPCGPGHEGAKDLNFVGMPYGTPVFAMESGVVVEARRDRIPCQGPPPDCLPNNVVVQGSDGFYTEYAHVKPFRNRYLSPIPSIGIGRQIRAGQLLGYVDNSGRTDGYPHVHINRYTPGEAATLHSRPSYCDWAIKGVDAISTPLECLSPAIYHDIIPHRMNYYQWMIDNELRYRFGAY